MEAEFGACTVTVERIEGIGGTGRRIKANH
jgi:hypothetical protein